jgi:hypothetical protein
MSVRNMTFTEGWNGLLKRLLRDLRIRALWLGLIVIGIAGMLIAQTPLGTAFTYQGRLIDSGNAANGLYDLQFALFDDPATGNQVGTALTQTNINVSGGVFTVLLDFGASAFTGNARWLQIGVRPGGSSGSFTTLSPRQVVSPTPNALYALAASNATQLGGVAANQFVMTGDARLSDARNPLPNSANYIQNTTSQQASSNFNITGSGRVGGTLRVDGSGASSATAIGSFSSTGRFDVDAPFVSGGRFTVLNNGNTGINTPSPVEKLQVTGNGLISGSVGIGTPINPNAPLAFPAALGKKIILYPGTIGDAGFGVFGNELRIASDYSGADITFGYDNRTSGFTENMRFRASGALSLAGNDGVAGQVITSSGPGTPVQWMSPTNTLYQGTNMSLDSGFVTPPVGTSTTVPGLSQSINLSGNAKLLVQFGVSALALPCGSCSASSAYIDVMLDGVLENRVQNDIINGNTAQISGSWLLAVGAGNHTVAINAFSIGPAVRFGFGPSSTVRSSLIVQVIPQ